MVFIFLCLFTCEKDVFLFGIIYQLRIPASWGIRENLPNTPGGRYIADNSSILHIFKGIITNLQF